MISFLQTILVLIILGACGGCLDKDTMSIPTMLIIVGTSILLLINLDRYSKSRRRLFKRSLRIITDKKVIMTRIVAIKNISMKKMILIYKTRIMILFRKVVIK